MLDEKKCLNTGFSIYVKRVKNSIANKPVEQLIPKFYLVSAIYSGDIWWLDIFFLYCIILFTGFRTVANKMKVETVRGKDTECILNNTKHGFIYSVEHL